MVYWHQQSRTFEAYGEVRCEVEKASRRLHGDIRPDDQMDVARTEHVNYVDMPHRKECYALVKVADSIARYRKLREVLIGIV